MHSSFTAGASRHIAWRALLVAMLAIALVPAAAARQGHAPNSPTPESIETQPERADDWVTAAIRPELVGAVLDAMPADLPIYEMAVTLEPQAERGDVPTVTGTLFVNYVNTTGSPLDALPFRLYANDPDAESDAQVVSDVTVDGEDTDVTLSVANSVLTVPFDEPLAPEATTTIEMGFAAFLPIDTTTHYGIFGYGSEAGTWALAHWYPVIAGRDPSGDWMLDPPSANGDPIFSETALYDVTVATEPDWRLATTGVAFGEPSLDADGMEVRRFVSGPVRDFTMVADEDFEVVTGEVDGITVNSWFNPGEERIGTAVLDYAIQSLGLFDELLAQYPYRELDLMPVDMRGAAGCEFPGLIYMGLDYYARNTSLDTPNALDFTVAHEVVHQWFYGLVGNNQYADAFIDEGMTNYLSAQVYFEREYGEAAANRIMEQFVRTPFERTVDADGDVIVDQPTDAFPSGRDYAFAAYTKAPLGFEAIREAIGDEAFFAALRSYIDEFSYEVASPTDLLAAFETASGQDLQGLWDTWFTETNGLDPVD